MRIDIALFDTVMESYRAIGAPDRVLLGLSGGADSLALLFILLEIGKEQGFSLDCVHVNHHLRDESDAEAEWLASLMNKLAVPLKVMDAKVPAGGNLEAQARQVRYEAFQHAMSLTHTDVLALAHHANDQAETMLMRLMHGTGTTGLSAMRELTGHVWRPLIHTPKEHLVALLRQRGQRWIEDMSNQDTRFLRNAIRQRITPALDELSPGSIKRMASTAKLLGDEEAAWTVFEDRWLSHHASLCPPMVFLKRSPFMREPLAFRRRLVRRLCAVYSVALDRTQTDAICALPNTGKTSTMNLPAGAYALVTEARLHILPASYEGIPEPSLGQIDIALNMRGMGDGKRLQAFDEDKLAGSVLRYAMPGDRIIPLGMDGSQSLTKYLSDRKVDKPFRRWWPLLARENTVLWVIGLGMAQTAAITGETRNRICYFFRGALPGDLSNGMGEQ
ncbi:MAG: tRNA lysidine(34) synthetase TilS [Clostridiales bacterium]|jgi:tRNA(Ile)-lysidine synthase|nr:tRNA lysidine(34) synthetase TilS [Clostridiales bacterium]